MPSDSAPVSAATSLSASATFTASIARTFDLLASPYRHHEFDASGMVGESVEDDPITKRGQVFRMRMHHTGSDGRITDYETANHVVALEPNRTIAWAPGPVDGDPLGWLWRWDLKVKGKRDQKVKITLTYDWSGAPAETVARYHVPLVDEAGLERSVRMLGALVAS